MFSVLGYLAHMSGTGVQEVVSGGPGLAFITYPTAIAAMGGWTGIIIGVLFFICLLTLGIDSAFSILEGVLAGVKDSFRRAHPIGQPSREFRNLHLLHFSVLSVSLSLPLFLHPGPALCGWIYATGGCSITDSPLWGCSNVLQSGISAILKN